MQPTARNRRNPGAPRSVHRLARGAAAVLTGLLMVTLAPGLTSSASADEQLPPGRTLVPYTVKPGDTATGLAVKYRAWTRELISYNNLDSKGTLRVGQEIKIPVVDAAVGTTKPKADSQKNDATRKQPAKATPKASDPSRAEVRRIIIDTARAQGVDPYLALAISWQEAGWRMHHVSSANAIGAMQVLPSTGDWMEQYAGCKLDLRNTRDNVLAGVLLLKVLDRQTSSLDNQIAAYYQGIGAVRRHGIYQASKPYVKNVKALRERLKGGWNPA
ncbi:transglycosylase SLT domain-containing protein [Nocardioides sp. AE5]|uniref:transglycosylase SLT domain-containing protein n=1 Tax=Nocardioides sp. AE5 TaxID=2962573 RepID=UPI0028815D6C|nr:transglycosylase SLT domain-containing protein [Nocardioides sp. AE5]MDT0201231.1 transglycosylase SLT domain-containing protein [Nocardioides sp. AE5]